MKTMLARSLVVGAALSCSAAAIAQDAQRTEPAPAITPEPAQPTWTDPEFAMIGAMLSGTWKTEKPAQEIGGAGPSVDIVMAIVPVAIEGLPNALYVESARADAMQLPYRQSILQLYRSKGSVKMRTLEPHSITAQTAIGAWVGLWAAKELLPSVTSSVKAADFIGTLDMVLTPSEGACRGKTPYAYPTAWGGAVEMTSEFSVTADRFTTSDHGCDADGKEVWGPPPGGYVFKRYNALVTTRHMSGGLIAIDFASPEGDLQIQKEDFVTAQYTGWTTTGVKFDSSRTKPTPFTFTQGGLIQGWNLGLIGATKGTIRRLYIPAALGYGERGNPGANIAPNTDLIFEIEIVHVERPEPQALDEHAHEGNQEPIVSESGSKLPGKDHVPPGGQPK